MTAIQKQGQETLKNFKIHLPKIRVCINLFNPPPSQTGISGVNKNRFLHLTSFRGMIALIIKKSYSTYYKQIPCLLYKSNYRILTVRQVCLSDIHHSSVDNHICKRIGRTNQLLLQCEPKDQITHSESLHKVTRGTPSSYQPVGKLPTPFPSPLLFTWTDAVKCGSQFGHAYFCTKKTQDFLPCSLLLSPLWEAWPPLEGPGVPAE